MTRKADGKAKQTERVAFTRPAAERIAKVVREVEAGYRDQAGISFGAAPGFSQKAFRMATFTAPWNKNDTQAVTFRGVTATANAVNLFANVGGSGTKNCAIAKDGTAWYLIAAEC